MSKLICTAYILFLTGLVAGQVGTMPTPSEEPNSWWLPVLVFYTLFVPAVLGYLAGRVDEKKEIEK